MEKCFHIYFSDKKRIKILNLYSLCSIIKFICEFRFQMNINLMIKIFRDEKANFRDNLIHYKSKNELSVVKVIIILY